MPVVEIDWVLGETSDAPNDQFPSFRLFCFLSGFEDGLEGIMVDVVCSGGGQ